MKKFIVLITLMLFAFAMQAQKVNSFWGTAADTLTASVTKTQVIPIGTNTNHDFTIAVFTDHVSGTDTYTAKVEFSLDGTNYHAILSAPDQSKAAASDNSIYWSSRFYKTFSVAGDTTTVMVHTPVLAKFIKVTLTATSATQKELCYGYYLFTPFKD